MEHEANKLILKMQELEKQQLGLREEILNNPDIPQEIKDTIIELQKESEKQKEEYEKYLEENKHRKIKGWNPDTFEPIYED